MPVKHLCKMIYMKLIKHGQTLIEIVACFRNNLLGPLRVYGTLTPLGFRPFETLDWRFRLK